jgi:2-keto-4-pentenoate hydratase/2-oxohepta-3-ene-1,7-dioic acid hydratase in catechol pathway
MVSGGGHCAGAKGRGKVDVKLLSFQVQTPDGPAARIGALVDGDRVVDLTSACYVQLLMDQSCDPRAASRIARALVPPDMVAFIEGGKRTLDAAREALNAVLNRDELPMEIKVIHPLKSLKLLPAVPRPPMFRDFMAFEEHVKGSVQAMGLGEVPKMWYEFPVFYKGNVQSLAAHGDDVLWPSYSRLLDFELEMAAIIGRRGADIPEERAGEHIFGYTILNDFSARDVQGQEMSVGLGPAKGKDFRTGTALGPWIVTAEELPDPYNLRMTVRVNGEVWSEGHSGTVHWRFEQMIAHASRSETLFPGEVFGSGTVGRGCGLELGRWLKPGDVVELEIEGIGVLRNRVVRPDR